MHPIYPASLAAALYPRQAKSNRDRGASADGTRRKRNNETERNRTEPSGTSPDGIHQGTKIFPRLIYFQWGLSKGSGHGTGQYGKMNSAARMVQLIGTGRRWVLRGLDALRHIIAAQGAEIPYQLLTESSSDVITLADAQLRRLYVSPACLEVMGYTQGELVGRTPKNLLHPDDAARVMSTYATLTPDNPKASASWRMLRRDGTYRWMETTYHRLTDGRIVSVVRDIESRKMVEQQLEEALCRVERLAMLDPLTDLANRRNFLEGISRNLTANVACAVLLIDLDKFKQVNDEYGHAIGDQVLIEIAERFRRTAGIGALVARLGGDEFGILLNDDRLLAEDVAQAIVEVALQSIEIGRLIVDLGASVGIALYPQHGREVGVLLLHADQAMYLAKRSGRSGYRMFEGTVDLEMVERSEM
jgi:diguanylate cyclase (GGDEF)-like protein/PAS domain S-box-containing protein